RGSQATARRRCFLRRHLKRCAGLKFKQRHYPSLAPIPRPIQQQAMDAFNHLKPRSMNKPVQAEAFVFPTKIARSLLRKDWQYALKGAVLSSKSGGSNNKVGSSESRPTSAQLWWGIGTAADSVA